jgi:hypothetical protein
MPTPHDPTEIPDRLMAELELAAPEIDTQGGLVTEDPADPELPAP